MITLAAGGGDYIFLVVMLVFGLINWLANKAKEGSAPPPKPGNPARPSRPSAPPSADPEAERMRRFLEALGVPADEPEPPAPISPRIPPPPRNWRFGPTAKPSAPPPPLPERSLDEEDTTTEPVERIHLRELQTTAVPEFQTVSSRVSADPDGDFETLTARISAVPTVERLSDVVPPKEDSVADAGTILAKLRSRADVRTALVLREILGPPRSLQR